MGKRYFVIIFFLIFSRNALANQCHYKTETITENGIIISTKEIKVCEETTYISGGFWNDLIHSEQGNELFWNTLISIYSLTGG
jgi:hypothetical protein|tara:strand:- start:226 stop:474 length:249 start_codon:yes stop_codon:yes gene_type:complete